jgi:dTDP-4-amino-4,6-dideoxy-D-galactose acyltransferase
MNLNDFINPNNSKLYFYSPFNFERSIENEKLVNEVIESYKELIQKNHFKIINVKEVDYLFIFQKLEWDSKYFGIETFKLINVLTKNDSHLSAAIEIFVNEFLPTNSYCFIEIPSEDIKLIQSLGHNKFSLIETRLTYYNNDLGNFNFPRYKVREANSLDIENLKNVASQMRNDYDRFHADSTFDQTIADNFLATYVENSILGFCDFVMVPNEEGLPSDSFLTANYFLDVSKKLDYNISKMVLSAVSSSTNKGWYIKLISEMTYHLRDNINSQCIFLNTQSTNRAVFKTWEKLNYKLGFTTHIFSITK